jgi:tetratricopeptide (TPR) repeat protein
MAEYDVSGAAMRRGLVLREQGRYREAEEYFREALGENPHDWEAFLQLSVCLLNQTPGRPKEALDAINEALKHAPNEREPHTVKALILCQLDRPKEALVEARSALALDPCSSSAFVAEAQAHIGMQNWAEAEESARNALAYDADNSSAANLLSLTLRMQKRKVENADQIRGMLARDPEDSWTHVSAGWAALQNGERKVGETHFLEALRLDPECESAREGLLHSFRARSPLYKAYLAYCFAMQRLKKGARWAIILGLYFGMRFSRVLFTGSLEPVGIAIVLLYLLFVCWTWLAKGTGNLILLFDGFAKHALRTSEKLEGITVGGGLLTGLVLVAFSFVFSPLWLFILGVGLCAAAMPFSMVFTNASVLGRTIFGAIAAYILTTALLTCIAPLFGGSQDYFFKFSVWNLALMGVCTWLGSIPALRRE